MPMRTTRKKGRSSLEGAPGGLHQQDKPPAHPAAHHGRPNVPSVWSGGVAASLRAWQDATVVAGMKPWHLVAIAVLAVLGLFGLAYYTPTLTTGYAGMGP